MLNEAVSTSMPDSCHLLVGPLLLQFSWAKKMMKKASHGMVPARVAETSKETLEVL